MVDIIPLLVLGLLAGHILLQARQTLMYVLPSQILLASDTLLQFIIPFYVVAYLQTSPFKGMATLLWSLGFVCILLAYYLTLAMRIPEMLLPAIRRVQTSFSDLESFGSIAAKVLLIAGGGCVVLTWAALRSVPILSADIGNARLFGNSDLYFSTYRYIYWAGIQAIIYAMTLLVLTRFVRGKQGRTFLWLVLGAGLLVATVQRSPIFTVFLASVLFYYQLHPERFSILKGVMGVLGMGALLMLALWARDGYGRGDPLVFITGAISSGSTFVDFAEFAEALRRFQGHAFLMGQTYIGNLVSFIPDNQVALRWKDWTKVLFDAPPQMGGYRLSMVGEPYFNFGVAGIVLKCVAVGFWAALADRAVCSFTQRYREGQLTVMGAFVVYVIFDVLLSWAYTANDFLFGVAKLGSLAVWMLLAILIRDMGRISRSTAMVK